MKTTIAIKSTAAYTLFTWASTVLAHDGHSQGFSHWHASDTLGFMIVAALTVLALWLSRDGK